jgi:hypothetical protein
MRSVSPAACAGVVPKELWTRQKLKQAMNSTLESFRLPRRLAAFIGRLAEGVGKPVPSSWEPEHFDAESGAGFVMMNS